MRTRSRVEADGTRSIPYEVLGYNGEVIADYPQLAPKGGRIETIIDEKPNFSAIGDCVHNKVVIDDMSALDGVKSILSKNSYWSNSHWTYFPTVQTRPGLLLADTYLSSPPPPISFDTDQSLVGLAAKAAERMSKLALTNTIWETKDFPGMFDYQSRRKRIGDAFTGHRLSDSPTWRRFLKLSDKVRPLKGSKRLLQFGRLLRDEGLGWAFGWSPTLQDMRNISRELPRAWKKKDEELQPFTVRSKSLIPPVIVQGSYADRYYNTDILSGVKVAGIRVVPPKPQEYYYNQVRAFDKLVQELNGNPLSTIWEAVPWSFAIDWFLSVDDLINDAWLRKSGWNVQPWVSQKKTSERTWRHDINIGVNSFTGDWITTPITWSHSRTIYHRTKAQLPGLLSNIRFRAGPKQALLGTLLGWGIIDRRRAGR